MYEVFDPKNGVPVYRVRFQFIAWLLCKWNRKYDYDLAGQGW